MLIAGIRAMAQDYVVYGHVYDAQTGESLIAANVYNPNTLRGTTTNEFGYYSLKMSKDNASICVSYVGYETFSMKLPLAADTMIVVRLVPNRTLKEIVVTDNRPEVGVNSTRMGASTVPLDIIRNMPMMLSEPDVLKTIQALPGVQSGMIGSSGIHVRGGDPDQNLFLLDGMPLYNVSHAFGLVSVFQPEAIKNVDFYKCSFPARFGGRLSSIVDVRTKDGDMKNYYGSFSIGLLTSHINLEGPIVKDRTSFIISARRSYFDWITYPIAKATMDGESLGMSIYDANIKINHKFSDRQRLYLFFYSGRDNIHYKWDGEWYNGGDKEKVKHRWGNTLATIRLNSVVSPRIFHNLTLAYTGYASNLYNYLNEWNKIKDDNGQVINTQEETTESEFKSGINDISLSSDFDFSITPVSHAKFGASVIYHNFHPDVQTSKYKEEGFGEPIDSSFYNISQPDELVGGKPLCRKRFQHYKKTESQYRNPCVVVSCGGQELRIGPAESFAVVGSASPFQAEGGIRLDEPDRAHDVLVGAFHAHRLMGAIHQKHRAHARIALLAGRLLHRNQGLGIYSRDLLQIFPKPA